MTDTLYHEIGPIYFRSKKIFFRKKNFIFVYERARMHAIDTPKCGDNGSENNF